MNPLLIYVATVSVLGALLMARTLVGLSRTLHRRRAAIEGRERFNAINTVSPFDDANEVARRNALSSVEGQTTAVRRLVIPLIIAMTGALIAIPFLGEVPATTLSLVAAAVTVLFSVAGRSALENGISGLLMAGSGTFNIGDTVTVGEHYGTVEDIGITHTTVKIWDWRRFVVPNAQFLSMSFVNHSLHDRYRWTEVKFYVAYGCDLEAVRAMAMEAMEHSEYFQPYEDARCWVMGLDKEAIELWVVGWAETPSEAWLLACDVRGRVHAQLSAQGLLPHRYVVDTR